MQIIPELETGGAELSTIEIAGAIVRAGGRAIVLSEGGQLVARLEAAGGELVPFPAKTKNPFRLALNARRIRRMIAEEGVDLVHARSRAPAWSARSAARAAGVPFVTTYHGIYKENSALKKAYNRVMAEGDVVIANSGYTAEIIRTRYQLPENRLVIIHRGVDTAVFDPAAVSADRKVALRRAWGLPPDLPIVLHAARLSKWKGQSVVIEAARRLCATMPATPFVVVLAGSEQGRDAYRSELERLVEAAGLGDVVRLPGHVADMAAAMAIADVAVVASVEPEAFGRTAIEAQAMGCPVIATAHGAPAETVIATPEDARSGWLVAPGDPGPLAEAIGAALALAPADRSAMGTRGRANVLQDFTLEAMRTRTLEVYDRLLGSDLAASYVAADPQSRLVTRPPGPGLA
ncbi:MAG: glycosyltransferase family 4 protein [Hyphomicrobium sp.]|nr:glycosyltransferase family 4 protein [Hyphomicrobium sp.]